MISLLRDALSELRDPLTWAEALSCTVITVSIMVCGYAAHVLRLGW